MINIDGSHNEGGGQRLLTALTLSLATLAPFRIEKIRDGRKQPGLLRQHLAAVRAAAQIGHSMRVPVEERSDNRILVAREET